MARQKPKEVIPTEDDYVLQSNEISRAAYSMPVFHRRLLYVAMAQVRPEDDTLPWIEMKVGDILKALGMDDHGRSYQELRAAAAALRGYVFDVDTPDGWDVFGWVTRCRYVKTRDAIKIKLDDAIAPWVTNLKEQFSFLYLADIAKLQGRYSQRIFEMIMANKGHAGRNGNKKDSFFLDLMFEDIRVRFKIAPHEYKRTGDLRTWVIDKPVQEINKANLGLKIKVDTDTHRHGRRLLGVRLWVKLVGQNEPREVNPEPATESEKEDDLWVQANPELYERLCKECKSQLELEGFTPRAMAGTRAMSEALIRLKVHPEAVKPKKKRGKKS